MFKNKIDYKLINFAVLSFIVFMIYQTSHLWLGFLAIILKIIMPFLTAFIIAYALYPLLKKLREKKVPKPIAIIIILSVIISIIVFLISMIVPILFEQLSSLFSAIISFIKTISLDYNLNLGDLQKTLSSEFNEVIKLLGKYITDGTINFIGTSLNYLSLSVIVIASSIYFLIDMENIRSKIKKILLKKGKKMYFYIKTIDKDMKNYLVSFAKIGIISLFEYYFAFMLIGHPNALLIGSLALVAGIIPYFGGLLNNFLACITAFVISPKLFVASLIVSLVLSIIDTNIFNPLVYGKSNNIHPIVVIISVFAGGILFGFVGIIISLPLAIILLSTYKFFQEDISDKIEGIKLEKSKNK